MEYAANYVDGSWRPQGAGPTLPVINPATGEAIGRAPLSSADEVNEAVAAAARAFPAWRATPVTERARTLFRLRELLDERHDELAESLTVEHGKPVRETWGEIRRGIENVEHACGVPTLVMGDTVEEVAPGIDATTWRQPLGVFGVVTPYNFPVMIPLWFWPYAVAAGNTVVLKPSEQDPFTHQRIVQLAEEAGLPAGVLNVVHGGKEAAEAICDHPGIQGISFVGSSSVAKAVYARAARAGKRVQALGGAKNHLVVLPDADLEAATASCSASIFGSTGQRCLAGSVIVGVGDAYRPLRERFLDAASSIRLGDGLDPDTRMGPVISSAHLGRVRGYVDRAAALAGSPALDGRGATVPGFEGGYWIGPTVFEDVDPESELGTEEVFGPVAALNKAATVDEALAALGRSRYGNACSIFTSSGKAAREWRYKAGIGMIGVNVGVAAPMACLPFGGARASFYGDLKAQGRDAVAFFTDQRVVIERW